MAVTVMEDVVLFFELELPPQPTTPAVMMNSNARLRYTLRRRKNDPKQSSPPPRKARVIVPCECHPNRNKDCCGLVWMVNVVCDALPLGVTVAGLKLQLAPAGSPEQVKLTCWLKPPAGVTLMAVVTD
jgi:hypothetical protein